MSQRFFSKNRQVVSMVSKTHLKKIGILYIHPSYLYPTFVTISRSVYFL